MNSSNPYESPSSIDSCVSVGNAFDLHLRGIFTAVCYPLAVFLYKWDSSVHDAAIDMVAKVMMWSGVVLIAPFFIAPCLSQKRFLLLCYAIPIPIVTLLWILGVPPGIR